MKLLRDVVNKRSTPRPALDGMYREPALDEMYREWLRINERSMEDTNRDVARIVGLSSGPSVVTIPVSHSVLTGADIRAQMDRLARARMREYYETT